jgi:putative NIF3 family GTP cyclohydrolase 1 type 2
MYKIICIIVICLSIGFVPDSYAQNEKNQVSAHNVLELMRKNINGKWSHRTIDTIKIGNPDDVVKGIATCMFVDMNVLKKAVESNCNLIVTHEPFTYDGMDNIPAYLKDDGVLKEKLAYINDHHLIILRWHDHAHMNEPDQIMEGMAVELGWKVVNRQPMILETKEQKLGDLASYLKKFYGIEAIRVIGNPDIKIRRIGFIPGLAPTPQMHLGTLSRSDVDAVLIGEAREWEIYMYAVDAFEQGKNKAAIFIGHGISEEPGMKYVGEWMKTFLPGIPVTFIKNDKMWWTPE